MKIRIAKTSGFCFGVNRAVEIVDNLLKDGKKVCTLGPIIHNSVVTKNFKERGAAVVEAPSFVPKEAVLVVRSHGVTKSTIEFIKSKNINYVDATCPFVKKIHNIVAKNSSDGNNILLIAGNENHPEMIGIRSYFNGVSYTFKDVTELKEIVQNHSNLINHSVIMVAQTTFSVKEWEKCVDFSTKVFTKIRFFDTICNTTSLRQEEALILSKKSDLMVVIGGKNSSNTHKLYDICSENAKTIWVEDINDLQKMDFSHYENISITAGASTPVSLVEQVYEFIKNFK